LADVDVHVFRRKGVLPFEVKLRSLKREVIYQVGDEVGGTELKELIALPIRNRVAESPLAVL
jgi:hypothetical protein